MIYDKVCRKPPYLFTNPPTAEMIKYANNAFLATKISFINQMASICQFVPGTNIDKVGRGNRNRSKNRKTISCGRTLDTGVHACQKTCRRSYRTVRERGRSPFCLMRWQKINDGQIENILRFLELEKDKIVNKRISVLGLAFKENTDDIRESVSIRLIRRLFAAKI